MNIKVCGITTPGEVIKLNSMGINYAGIPVNGSQLEHTFVNELEDLDIQLTAVFRNPEELAIQETMEQEGFQLVQLDGDESVFLCEQVSGKWEVIKTIRVDVISGKPIESMLEEYDEVCDYYLFDTVGAIVWDSRFWDRLKQVRIEKPFFLSGCFVPPEGGMLKAFSHPDFYGINLSKGLEKADGKADFDKLQHFLSGLAPITG